MNFVSRNIYKFHIVYSVLAGTSFTMAQAMIKSDATSGCHRLLSVTGYKGKQNDVIVCGSILTAKQHVIFFGGDVQDYEENMKLHSPQFIGWSLEKTAAILNNRFKDSCIFVIKPSRMFRRSLSIYQNFLNFNSEGNPEFSANSGCFLQCLQLYYSAVDRATRLEKDTNNVNNNNDQQCPANSNKDECHISDHPPVTLMAFSKGCVVLNQMVFELKRNKDQVTIKEFLNRLSDLYWLDSGHNGGSKTWVTDDEPLKELVTLKVKINVHVTPYQVNDTGRPWIGKEQRQFVDKLKLFGADVVEKKHFAEEMPSLDNHFKLLECI